MSARSLVAVAAAFVIMVTGVITLVLVTHDSEQVASEVSEPIATTAEASLPPTNAELLVLSRIWEQHMELATGDVVEQRQLLDDLYAFCEAEATAPVFGPDFFMPRGYTERQATSMTTVVLTLLCEYS